MIPSTAEPAEPAAPYDFLKSFLDTHEQAGYPDKAAMLFDWYFTNGYIIKTPSFLIIGGPEPGQPDDPGVWHVAWAEAHPDLPPDDTEMIAQFLKVMPHYRPKVRWGRYLKGIKARTYSTDRLLALVSRHHGRNIQHGQTPVSGGAQCRRSDGICNQSDCACASSATADEPTELQS